jgi:hypothetical protein
MTITIVRAERTCTACPSQWDMWDDEGNYIYVRYRHGHLTVSYDVGGEMIFETGDYDGDGFMTERDLIDITAEYLNFCETQWETEWIDELNFEINPLF